jgi:hypothetical protein
MTPREIIRLLLVAVGVICCAIGIIFAVVLLSAKTEPGVVKTSSTLYHGEPTNSLYVLWGSGVVLHPKPGDLPLSAKNGDPVTVLVYGKEGGTLRSAPSLWRVWRGPVGFAVVGAVLLVSGLLILRRRDTPNELRIPQPV